MIEKYKCRNCGDYCNTEYWSPNPGTIPAYLVSSCCKSDIMKEKAQYTQFELMAEIESLARINELLTARCKEAEDLIVECKDTILYIKQYVDGQGLSAEDDGCNMIKTINDFLGL